MGKGFKSTTFLAILSCWLWSTAFVGIKIGLAYHTPFQFAGMRFFIAGLMLFFFYGNASRYWAEIKNNLKFVLALCFFQGFAQYALFYSGINLVPAALAAMIIGAQPMFVAIVAHFSFQNDKITPLKTFSILIGVSGIALITLGRSKIEMKSSLELLGIALLLINNFVSGYSNVLIAKHSQNVSPVVMSSVSIGIGGLVLFAVSIPTEGIHLGPFPARYWGALVWLSFLSATAITIWYSLLKRPGVKVSILNVWKFLIPVSGASLSWLILPNEQPDIVSLLGMLIIASSLIVLNYTNRRKAKKSTSP